MTGIATRVPRRNDRLMIMWDPDSIYYECKVSNVFVHKGHRFHDLQYTDGDEEFYVNLHHRKWRFVNPQDNLLPRIEREQDHPEMDPDDYPKEGDKVEVLWHVDSEYYNGTVTKVTEGGLVGLFHDIQYENGESEIFVDLWYRKWKWPGQTDLEEEEEERVRQVEQVRNFDHNVASNVKRLFGA